MPEHAVPVPPCLSCGEPRDQYPVVSLREGFLVGPGASYFAQYECWVCYARGPRGVGPTPEAALINCLTRAVDNAAQHRAWTAAGRPALPHEVSR